MADEYIRLDTTIMGLDGLINEAPTGSQARALFCAKDMIYDQQRYVSEMKPVKRGTWLQHGRPDDYQWCCSACKKWIIFAEHDLYKHHFCGNCGARMDGAE